jgi:uncharacterized membrane protein
MPGEGSLAIPPGRRRRPICPLSAGCQRHKTGKYGLHRQARRQIGDVPLSLDAAPDAGRTGIDSIGGPRHPRELDHFSSSGRLAESRPPPATERPETEMQGSAGSRQPLEGGRRTKLICAISGKGLPRRDLVPLDNLLPSLSERIRVDHPGLGPDAFISRGEAARYRALYVEELMKAEHGELTELDRQVAESMATHETLAEDTDREFDERRTFGERVSDHLAKFGGSWTFIIWFVTALLLWIVFNQAAPGQDRFDPYPYILLNLILSCVAALQAPIIMMSQRRQEAKDRLRSQNDYQVNLKAELEIRALHEKIDHLISRQWQRLAEIQQMQLEAMHDMAWRNRER